MNLDLERALATEGWMSLEELTYLAYLSCSVPPAGSIVEIGSFKGRSACALAINPSIFLFCVDPWTKYGFGDFTAYHQEFLRNTAHLHNVLTIREYSVVAAHKLFDYRFDVVFIDGDHTAEQVRADINAWRPLLKRDGILCGHDFGRPDWPDVETVVKELIPSFHVVPNTSIWTTEGI
jgi:predicted O-methyltransferase YrrM